jgi:hypothetical protein
MFNALVWSFDFDLRDMSNEVWVSAIDWLFLFVSCFQIGSCSWVLIYQLVGNGDFWLVRFPGFWLVDDGTHLNPSTTRLYLKKANTAYSSRSTWVHSMCYPIFSFMCMFCRSLFVLCTFSFGHCVIYSSSIYGFWLPLWLSSSSSSHPVLDGVRVAHLFSFPALRCAQCWQCFLISLSGFYNVSLMTFSISENTNIKKFHRKHQF